MFSPSSYGSCPYPTWAALTCAWKSCRCQRENKTHAVLQPPPPTRLARAPAMRPGSTTGTQRSQSTTCDLWEGVLPPGMVVWCSQGCGRSHGHRLAEPPGAALCGHCSSLPDGGCLCWAPGLLLVLFRPGCQPGKQGSQPKQQQVERNRENGSNIPACRQQRFQSNGAGEAEPAELPGE